MGGVKCGSECLQVPLGLSDNEYVVGKYSWYGVEMLGEEYPRA